MLSFLLGVVLIPCILGVILVPPQSVNTTLNSTVIFTCIANASHIDWYVDNTTEDTFDIINTRNIGPSVEMMVTMAEYGNVLASNISVPATVLPNNNGTEIRCKVADCPVSSVAVVLVQGILGPVVDLHVEIGNGSVLVMWHEPYSLNGVPILGFEIVIENTTGMVILDSYQSSSMTDIEVGSVLTRCQTYQVNVWARNAVGSGSVATMTWFYAGVLPALSKSDVSTVVSVVDMNFTVSTTVKPSIACPEQAPYQVTVQLFFSSNDVTFIKHPYQLVEDHTPATSLSFVIGGLPPQQQFDTDVLLCSSAGCTTSSKVAPFSTFDTQQVLFGANGDNLCFMCIFLVNTSSSGCDISVHGIIRANTALRVLGSNHSDWSCPQGVTVDSVIGTTVILFDVNDDGDIVLAHAITVMITSSNDFISLGLSGPYPATASMVSSSAVSPLVSVSTVSPLVTVSDEVYIVLVVVIPLVVCLLMLLIVTAGIILAVVCQRHQQGQRRRTIAVEQDIPIARNLIYGLSMNIPPTNKELSAMEKNDVEALKASGHSSNEFFRSAQVGPHYDTIPIPGNDAAISPGPLYETVPMNSNELGGNTLQAGTRSSTSQQQDISLSSFTECPAYQCRSSSGNYYRRS